MRSEGCLSARAAAAVSGIVLGALATFSCRPGAAAAERLIPPPARLTGFSVDGAVPATRTFSIVVELAPATNALDADAAAVADPASPMHHKLLTHAQFTARYGRSPAEIAALAAWLRASGATGIEISSNRLVAGATFDIAHAERAFKTRFARFSDGARTLVAPLGPLSLPNLRVRAVRGVVLGAAPRLAIAEAPHLPTDFRGDWLLPARFREAYDAVADGGAGQRIALIEDSSDRYERDDLARFVRGDFGKDAVHPEPPADAATPEPFAASLERLTRVEAAAPAAEQECGRDDRGQEPTIDLAAILTLAPQATIVVRDEAVCVAGGEGILALQHALDATDSPDAIVFPFVVGVLRETSAAAYGPVPIPYLEAALRGIPIVVPSGDDGAYGVHEAGRERAGVTYPCSLAYVVCAGGTSLGTRSRALDEGPWNDGTHAGGGGLSLDPRPRWQDAPSAFEFTPAVAKTRIVPDVAADAAGHLLIVWHGYATGGVGGTSESAALVAASLAAINAAVPPERRLRSAADLYVLARANPKAFRDISRENDRFYLDNTLRPRPKALPLEYRGILPSPAPLVQGCAEIQPSGCSAIVGYDAVTGIGSLLQQAAIEALAGPARLRQRTR
jgi:kumamolisin